MTARDVNCETVGGHRPPLRLEEGQMRKTVSVWIITLLAMGLLLRTSASAQSGAKNGEWRSYGADVGNTHYSPLDQINASNFSKLEPAWHFKTDNLGPRPEFQYEGTPLMANGMIYSTGGSRRAVFALDATNGELLWTHSEREGARGQN